MVRRAWALEVVVGWFSRNRPSEKEKGVSQRRKDTLAGVRGSGSLLRVCGNSLEVSEGRKVRYTGWWHGLSRTEESTNMGEMKHYLHLAKCSFFRFSRRGGTRGGGGSSLCSAVRGTRLKNEIFSPNLPLSRGLGLSTWPLLPNSDRTIL